MTAVTVWPPVLSWSASTHWDYEAAAMNTPRSCILCGTPSLLLSDTGKPCHKVCAERWFQQNPIAWAAYETGRAKKTKAETRKTDVRAAAGTDALFAADDALFAAAA